MLASWHAAHVVWAPLDFDFKSDLLKAATYHIDALPFCFPRFADNQVRALPVRCAEKEAGMEEAETACILQAVHLVMNFDQLADRIVSGESRTTRTVCYENSGECVLYSLGALLVLEGYIDLTQLDTESV